MTPLVVAWSMCAGACAIIAFMQTLLWLRNPKHAVYLLAVITSLAAAAVSLLELALMKAPDVTTYAQLLQWENLAVFMLLVPMVWFAQQRLQAPKLWLPILISALWCLALVVNFLSPYSIVFEQITSLDVHTTGWGEDYVIASGTLNPWVIVPNLATLLILGFVAHAGTRAWRAGDRRRALLVGGSIVLFTLIGGIQAPLVDAAWLHTPYMIGFAFLAIAFALGYELASSTWHSAQLEGQRAVALADAREARDELERLGRATVLGELTASIAHELNQPLAAILANAQTARRLLRHPELDREEMGAIVEDVIRDDKRAADVIHHLRALLQKHVSQRERLSLSTLVSDTVQLMHAELQAHRVQLSLDTGDAAWTLHADRIGLQQVVLNLMTNALRALRDVPPGLRQLHIAMEAQGDAVCLSVADRGRGISPEILPRLFSPFYTSNIGSSGMGLAICKRIVEAQGGSIEARNRSGGGAEFLVRLQLASQRVGST